MLLEAYCSSNYSVFTLQLTLFLELSSFSVPPSDVTLYNNHSCEATKLRSKLIQIAYVPAWVACARSQPHSWMYITAFASISSVAVEVEALSIQKENKRTLTTQIKCDVENFKPLRTPVSHRKPRFCKRRA